MINSRNSISPSCVSGHRAPYYMPISHNEPSPLAITVAAPILFFKFDCTGIHQETKRTVEVCSITTSICVKSCVTSQYETESLPKSHRRQESSAKT
eukprot:3692040-Amphidinium_carterae.1